MAKTSTRKGTSTKKAGRSAGRKTAKSATKKAAKATSRKAATGTSRKAAKKSPRKAAKRELIEPREDKRFVRRGAAGQFTESDDVGRSLTTDRRKKARTKAKRGQGDKGDR